MLMNYSKKVLDEIPSNGFDAISKGLVDPTAISDCASLSGTFFGSAELYMGISKLFYSYVIPVASGFEGMAKASIIENIQDTCWSNARDLRSEAITLRAWFFLVFLIMMMNWFSKSRGNPFCQIADLSVICQMVTS